MSGDGLGGEDGLGPGRLGPPMTPGELQVWAAVFASELEVLKSPPENLRKLNNDGAWKGWEEAQVANAVEMAFQAVIYLRESRGLVKKSWGGDVYEFLKQVIGSG